MALSLIHISWESVCRHKDEALVFQKETLEVRAAYRELGLQVEKLHHEPDDHIGYAALCSRASCKQPFTIKAAPR